MEKKCKIQKIFKQQKTCQNFEIENLENKIVICNE
jgi:hypothetical protein